MGGEYLTTVDITVAIIVLDASGHHTKLLLSRARWSSALRWRLLGQLLGQLRRQFTRVIPINRGHHLATLEVA